MSKRIVFRDEELYLILRDGFYHVYGTWEGKPIRKSCRTKDLAKAKLHLEDMRRECLSGWRSAYDADTDWRVIAGIIHKRHRSSATEREIPFDLKVCDVYGLMKSTDFRCAVSGISFSKQVTEGGWRDPWAPSIDRIENRQGYFLDNIRVVSLAANTAMNAWGYDTLLRLARGVVRTSISVSNEPEPAREPHVEISNLGQVIEFEHKIE